VCEIPQLLLKSLAHCRRNYTRRLLHPSHDVTDASIDDYRYDMAASRTSDHPITHEKLTFSHFNKHISQSVSGVVVRCLRGTIAPPPILVCQKIFLLSTNLLSGNQIFQQEENFCSKILNFRRKLKSQILGVS